MTAGAVAPIDPLDKYTRGIAALDQRIAELERAGGRSNIYLKPAADAKFVDVAGDTMTGALTTTTTTLTGANEALRFNGASSHAGFYHGTGARQGYLQGAASGIILNSETGRLNLIGLDGITMTPFKINGYTASTTNLANRLVLTDANGYIFGNYINMTADVGAGWPAYIAGSNNPAGGDAYLRWYNKSGVFSTGGLVTGRLDSTATGAAWNTCGICANPAAGAAVMSYHPGGIAMTVGPVNGFGNQLFVRDSAFNPASGTVTAAVHGIDSSRRYKRNINPYPLRAVGAGVLGAADVVARLQPVTFEYIAPDTEVPSMRRSNALGVVNRMRAAKGMPDYELPLHDCAVHECNGTAKNPCCRVLNRQHQFHGLIAEDVYEVIPEAVLLDTERIPSAIDLGQLIAVSIAAIQELTARVAILEEV